MRHALATATALLLAWPANAGAQEESGAPDDGPEPDVSALPQQPPPSPGDVAARVDPEDDRTRALERVLVQRGGLILRPGAVELEPAASYTYLEPSGVRRDIVGTSAGLRVGLPLAAQADARVPFVLQDAQRGRGTASGIGDVQLGLTKLLVAERESVPELLVAGRWKTATGTSGRLPTGSGTHALEGLLTAVRRDDPLVLLGSVYYVWNLRSGADDPGDALGAVLALVLAATPDTSVLVDVDAASFSPSRVAGQRVEGSDRLSAILEVGVSRIVAWDLLLNVTIGMGLTPAAPELQLAVTVPFRL